ncbi:MAG TPA: hypothetical protein PKX15_08275 [Bacteroidales bacterium]|nr:hypothetical protein [Bacteroidales bacterium]
MADPNEYYHPKPPGNAPYDPSVGDPAMMKDCRWRIKWFNENTGSKVWGLGSGQEFPKLRQASNMHGTRVLDAGQATPGRKLHVVKQK